MITIHDRNLRTVAKGPAQDILPERSATWVLERLDFYPTTPDGPAMLGASWADGSSGICDWLTGRACQEWLTEAAKTWAAGKIRVHFRTGRATVTTGLDALVGVSS